MSACTPPPAGASPDPSQAGPTVSVASPCGSSRTFHRRPWQSSSLVASEHSFSSVVEVTVEVVLPGHHNNHLVIVHNNNGDTSLTIINAHTNLQYMIEPVQPAISRDVTSLVSVVMATFDNGGSCAIC